MQYCTTGPFKVPRLSCDVLSQTSQKDQLFQPKFSIFLQIQFEPQLSFFLKIIYF